MADEARIQSSLSIVKTTSGIKFNNVGPGGFTADVDGTKGPSPGTVECPTTGATIDLLEHLDNPGLYEMYNVGEYPVDWGVYDPDANRAYTPCRLMPNEGFIGRFSPYAFGETAGAGTAGTGTIGTDDNMLFVRGAGGEGLLYIGAFDA